MAETTRSPLEDLPAELLVFVAEFADRASALALRGTSHHVKATIKGVFEDRFCRVRAVFLQSKRSLELFVKIAKDDRFGPLVKKAIVSLEWVPGYDDGVPLPRYNKDSEATEMEESLPLKAHESHDSRTNLELLSSAFMQLQHLREVVVVLETAHVSDVSQGSRKEERLADCKFEPDEDVMPRLISVVFNALVMAGSRLDQLSFHGCAEHALAGEWLFQEPESDTFARRIVDNVKRLDITGCEFKSLLTPSPRLEELTLASDCGRSFHDCSISSNDRFVKRFLSSGECRALRSMTLKRLVISILALQRFLATRPTIQSLCLENCHFIDDSETEWSPWFMWGPFEELNPLLHGTVVEHSGAVVDFLESKTAIKNIKAQDCSIRELSRREEDEEEEERREGDEEEEIEEEEG